MNKICTNIKQSKKLVELGIDINTADMHYMYRHWEIDENTVGAQSDANIGFDLDFYHGADNGKTYHYIPAWSLAALFNTLPKIVNLETLFVETSPSLWHIGYRNVYIARATNLVDAAFEMIVWLKENEKI